MNANCCSKMTLYPKMSDEGLFVPENTFAGSFLHAVANNIDINEETKSGEGKTHVLGSVIYHAERETAHLLTSGIIASDTRIRAVKNRCLIYVMHQTHTKN